jgi:hypothetical protein
MAEQVFGNRFTQALASEEPRASRHLTDIAQHKKTWPVDPMMPQCSVRAFPRPSMNHLNEKIAVHSLYL